jgi:uncharacterized protein YlaN (UPF0358 family)
LGQRALGRHAALKPAMRLRLDVERMRRAITLVVEANQLPRAPSVEEIFDRSFLPPAADRLNKL